MKLYLEETGRRVALLGVPQVLALVLVLLGLHWTTFYSYLLFHSLVELARIVVLTGIFVVAWHSRRWAANTFLLVVGTASLFVAALELLHTLAYRGLGVFPGNDANLPTQLWIAFRYLDSFSQLAAVLVIGRRFNPLHVFAVCLGLAALLGYSILVGVFPDCFVEGRGLTPFKVGSELVIVGVQLATIPLLYRARQHFDAAVLRLLVASLVTGAATELAFTQYVSVYGAANEIGHCLLLLSTYFVYRAVLVTGILNPFDLMFRSLKHKESELEAKVVERTAALRKSEAQARAFAENSPSLIYLTDMEGRHLFVNAAFERLVGLPRREIIGRTAVELFAPPVAAMLARNDRQLFARRRATVTTERVSLAGGERFLESIRFPVNDDKGGLAGAGGIATDITERYLAEERYGAIIRASMDAFMILGADGMFVEANDATCRLSGYPRERLLAMRVADVEAVQDAAAVAATLATVRDKGAARFDSQWRTATGEVRDVEVSINFLGEGGDDKFFAFVRDITERKAAVARIEFLAHYDVLTGLPNKLLFQDRFQLAAARTGRAGQKLALISLDLDNFKVINDSLGHVVGDEMLKRMATRLMACIRETDSICRVGGDEFLLLLGEVLDSVVVTAVAEKVLELLASPLQIEGQELASTVSIGIALYPDDGRDFDTLLKRADTAMFQAKEAGRNAYRFFDPGMNADAVERLALLARLRRAVERKELVLHYQPQIDLTTGAVIGAEALLRWQLPDLGLVPPGRFIPLAEDSGLIVPIGAWVLQEACRQAAAWQQAGLPRIVVAVNLSAVQFRGPGLYQTVVDALLGSGLAACCLELELTESILIRDTEAVLEMVKRFKALGLKLSIDDFGTGYSSLSYLRRFAVDKLKIDQSFVRDMGTDPEVATLVHAIIQMAKGLGLTTIAEGVESQLLVDHLRVYRCDEAQGYHFARPMPAEAFAEYLHTHAGGGWAAAPANVLHPV